MKKLKQLFLFNIFLFCCAFAYAGPASCYLFKMKIVLKNKTSFTAYIPMYGENFDESYVKTDEKTYRMTVSDKNMQLILHKAVIPGEKKMVLYKNLYFPVFSIIKTQSTLFDYDPKNKKNQFKTTPIDSDSEQSIIPKFAYTSKNDVVKLLPDEIKYCVFLSCTNEGNDSYNILETQIEMLDSLDCSILRNNKIKTIASASSPESILSAYYFFSTSLSNKEIETAIWKQKIFYTDSVQSYSYEECRKDLEKAKAALRESGIFTFYIGYYE
jgi:hypothetical protein